MRRRAARSDPVTPRPRPRNCLCSTRFSCEHPLPRAARRLWIREYGQRCSSLLETEAIPGHPQGPALPGLGREGLRGLQAGGRGPGSRGPSRVADDLSSPLRDLGSWQRGEAWWLISHLAFPEPHFRRKSRERSFSRWALKSQRDSRFDK